MANKIITAIEAAHMLKQKTPDRVYLLVRSKLIRGFKFGRQYLIDEESVIEYCRCHLGYLPNHSDTNSDTVFRIHDFNRVSEDSTRISKFLIESIFSGVYECYCLR